MCRVLREIVSGRSPAHVVAGDERTMAFMDISPLVRGHVLAIGHPRRRDPHGPWRSALKQLTPLDSQLMLRPCESESWPRR